MSLPATRNIVLGAGRIFFDEGPGAGELYIAETPGFGLNVASESVEIMSDDGPVAESLVNVTKSVSRNFSLTTKNITDDALALFVMGDKSTKTTTVATVPGKAINGGVALDGGRWYQLGVDSTHPAGIREIGSVAIKTGGTTHALTTDYVLDADTGRIYVVPGGGCDGAICTSDYATTASSWSQVASNDTGAKRGALRFVADNTAGENRDVFIPDCVMEPNGELPFKSRDNAQQMGFTVKVQKPDDGRASVYINGRAA